MTELHLAKNMNKALTIIIPTYNMEKYLDKCLRSLVIEKSDTLALLEVLVVIDGATDKSLEIANQYQETHPETFRVIEKPNGNYGSCINRGLKEATGKYIKILDADDYAVTENLEKLVLFLSQSDVDLVITNFQKVNERGEIFESSKFYAQPDTELNFSAIDPKKTMEMHMVTYKTENLRALGYTQTEKISYTDQEWIFMPMVTVQKFYYLDITVYNYLWGREGQTMDAAVYLKSQTQLMIVCLAMIREYKNCETDFTHKAYLTERLYKNLKRIYRTALVDNPDVDLQPLIAFDGLLKRQSRDAYKLVSRCKLRGRYPYIWVWRLLKYKRTPSLIKNFL